MKFTVAPEIFEKLPNMYIGAVVAHGIDNQAAQPGIWRMLDQYEQRAQAKFAGSRLKSTRQLSPTGKPFAS